MPARHDWEAPCSDLRLSGRCTEMLIVQLETDKPASGRRVAVQCASRGMLARQTKWVGESATTHAATLGGSGQPDRVSAKSDSCSAAATQLSTWPSYLDALLRSFDAVLAIQ